VENKAHLENIIRGCIENKRKSQQQLFELFYGKMFAICRRYHKDPDDAQEVLQLGFIKVFEKLDAFDYTGSFEGWMRRIFANTAIDVFRKNKKNPLLTESDDEFIHETETVLEDEEDLELTEIKASLAREAIEELSPAYKAVFNLYVIEEYTHKEIAEILGVSEGTSKSNLAKAKQNLQKILKEKYTKIDQ
jgi:RNA polymerase sigma factor (sigma-70 family)